MKAIYHNLDEGLSLSYLIPAVFVAIGGGVLCLYFSPGGIAILVSAAILISMKTGVEIDVAKKKIRSYKAFFGIKFGDWIGLKYYPKAKLRNVSRGMAEDEKTGQKKRVRNKTYTIELEHRRGKKRAFHEFTEYKLAKQASGILEKELGLEIHDSIEELRRHSSARRAS